MSRQRNHLCPDCGKPFSTATDRNEHRDDEHAWQGHEGDLPPEMRWMSGSAVESGWTDNDGWCD